MKLQVCAAPVFAGALDAPLASAAQHRALLKQRVNDIFQLPVLRIAKCGSCRHFASYLSGVSFPIQILAVCILICGECLLLLSACKPVLRNTALSVW